MGAAMSEQDMTPVEFLCWFGMLVGLYVVIASRTDTLTMLLAVASAWLHYGYARRIPR